MTPDQADELLTSTAAIITALALLIGALWQGARTRAELGQMASQLRPNGGGSLRDAVDNLTADVQDVKAQVQDVKAQIQDNGKDIRGVRRDIGRTADDVRDIRHAKEQQHAEYERRLERLEQKENTP